MPLLLRITSKGIVFHLEAILLVSINQAIKRSMEKEDKLESEFYMASYVIKTICTKLHFIGMDWVGPQWMH